MKNMNVGLIALVMDTLGTQPRKLKKHLGKIGTKTKIVELQKTAIVYFVIILQNFLEL